MGKKRSGGGLTTTQQAAKFLGVSVLAGAVLAGIALPAAGVLGLAAKGSVEGFDEIPANMKTPPLSERTTILDVKGNEIAKIYSRDRTVVDLADISPHMQKAIVAIEDARFYEHGAVDLKGVLRALNKNAQSGGVSEGASTLTQQYVKNVFIEEAGNDSGKFAAATEQSIGRKIKELKYAIQVEKELGKKRILQNYLNITFFGQQAYGVEAAARRYFSKSAKDLNLEQSALLAGLVQSPSRYDPVNDPREATKRRNMVLKRMADVKDITPQQAEAARKKPLGLKVSKPKNGCITAVRGAGFFCDYVRQSFLTDPIFGKTSKERAKRWNQGGLTIRTTLDPQAQNAVQKSITDHVYQTDSVATAVTLVEPGSGRVIGMGQSRPYGFGDNETQINLSADRTMGGSNFGFQTGSTFKPITAAAALEKGKPPHQEYSSPYEMEYPSPVATCKGHWRNDKNDPATVANENRGEVGPYRMPEATAKSVNTYFVQLISEIGVCPVTELAAKMGMHPASGDKIKQVPSVTLGSEGMSPLTMANAYATFANRGVYCTPVFIDSITGPGGKKLKVPESTCSRAMSTKTADTINTLLRGVVEDGTGRKAGLSSRASAGKTGTTDERKAAWFVGYTPNMAGAVWVGSPGPKDVEMVDITIGGVHHEKVFGADTPGPIWKDAMSGALEGKPAPGFKTVRIDDPDKKKKKKPGRGDDDKPRKPHKPARPGGDKGDDDPWPDITIPPGVIGGGDGDSGDRGNGGRGNGGGNGNGGWPDFG
ncbi:penicillin-binding protein [Streptomyces sp. AC536]|uniref:transglycosylase domain-containing protein n=1 Tax=Streptomyces buecherae TaxID=2763006 RepID=UPI00164E6BB3|nr:transglycosylase domain-containing protein [Streptomyces buecherae]MBC3984757.1 penicillin-binding protein [Streptomyces buecherae]QNJ41437.1 penicillin-binding protein [Streptomyces buecherae]